MNTTPASISSTKILHSLKEVAKAPYLHLVTKNPIDELTEEDKAYLTKANFYGIPLNSDYWCTISNQHMSDAVDCWDGQLRLALELGVNWTVGNYDPQGLDEALSEAQEEASENFSEYRRQVNAYFYSTRGC